MVNWTACRSLVKEHQRLGAARLLYNSNGCEATAIFCLAHFQDKRLAPGTASNGCPRKTDNLKPIHPVAWARNDTAAATSRQL